MKIASIRRNIFSALLQFSIVITLSAQGSDAMKWQKYELVFTSSTEYENPVQEVRTVLLNQLIKNGMIICNIE